MRLGALSAGALASALVVFITASAIVVPLVMPMPSMYTQIPEPIVQDRENRINAAVEKLEQSIARRDWRESQEHSLAAYSELRSLAGMGAAAPTLISLREQPKLAELRSHLDAATDWLREASSAANQQDDQRLDAALKRFHDAYGQITSIAK